MRCSKCGNDSTSGRRFCPECGSLLSNRCAKCGADNSPTAKFCEDCGGSLGVASAASTKSNDDLIRIAEAPAAQDVEGERKTVTALFADIKGSMELIEDLDPEEARAIIDPALKLMIEAVQHYAGYVAQSTGDGIFALFGAPIAHEDHPQRGLLAAFRMQQELKRYSERTRAEGRRPIQVRVGVNTGEVVVRVLRTGHAHSEYVPVGHSISLAARMQALAPIGSIAATEQVRKLCEGYFVFAGLGPTKVKGVSEAVNVYEVTGLGPLRTRLQRAAGRGLTKFVGREREMEALRHAADQAKAGHGQIVGAMAEPGVGKSRLFLEFKAKNQFGWMVLEAFSVSHGRASAYLPMLDLLHTYFKITPDDDARNRREKVTGRVLALDRTVKDTLPYLFALLGIVEGEDELGQMDAAVKKRRTLDAVKRILLRESLNQPLIVMFEDLHWIDEQTQEFLNLLADSLANAKILLVVNYRPEYSHQWGSKTYYTQLRLDPLRTESADEMLSALLGDFPDLAAVKKLIIERTEGNPFFMEELYQAMLEDGVIARNGAVNLVKPLESARIPTTVHGVLAARIDRLPADAKQLLQTLSVIGREFPLSLIRAVFPRPDDELDRMLSDLQLGEFIYEQPALGDTEFIFKHALTQEVAYNELLGERRKLLHKRVGNAIEALYADALDDHVVALANHFRQAGNAMKASDCLQRAGVVCVRRTAFAEAVSHLSAGLDLVESLPESPERRDREWQLLRQLAVCLTTTAGAGSAQRGDLLMRMKLLCEQSGNERRMLEVLLNRIFFHSVRNELGKECELGKEAVKLAERLGAHAWLELSLSSLGYSLLKRGDFLAAYTQLERAVATLADERPVATLADGPHLINPTTHSVMLARAYLSWVQWMLGFPNQARNTITEAVHHIRKEGSPAFSLAFALIYAAELHRFTREPDKTVSFSGEAMEIAEQAGLALLKAQARFEHGWGLAQGTQVAAGLEEVNDAIKELEATGAVASAWRAGPLAECWSRSGHPEKGTHLLKDAVAQATATGEHFYEAELRRLLGELTYISDSSKEGEAESTLRAARELAQRQGAKSLELRAATSLARLLERVGQHGEATDLLSSIYDSFTEGFETRDLKEAKDLLDRLSV